MGIISVLTGTKSVASEKLRWALVVMTVIAVIVFTSALKGCTDNLIPDWFSGPTKEEIQRENDRLIEEIKRLKKLAEDNAAEEKRRQEADAAAKEALEKKDKEIEDLKGDLDKAKKNKKDRLDKIEADDTLEEREKDRAVIEITANASWERYCRLVPAHPDCK